MLLTARKLLQEKAIAIENDMRGLLRNFGRKVGGVGAVGFDGRIRQLIDAMPDLAAIMAPLLAARQKLRETFMALHRQLLSVVHDDATCRRLMTIPGVGPVTSLAFTSSIDVPARFRTSKAVGPALGLTPRLHQSGSIGGKPARRPDRLVWRRPAASAALRSGADDADAGQEVVVVEGLGDDCRQAARSAEGCRRLGVTIVGGHASHVERWHRVPLDEGNPPGSYLTGQPQGDNKFRQPVERGPSRDDG
jgi:hypothetical protein